MKVLSLFSGIGAFDLGLSRAGFETVAFCEIEPFARRVLAKHWPGVPCYDDVRSLTADRLRADGISVDVICGGFPCQPHSVAGKRGAGADERDLWPEFARLIREVRPRWVLAENVPGLRSSESGRFFGGILRDLAYAGYDAEWHSISAADVGAPHIRDRVWIVAYAARDGFPRLGTEYDGSSGRRVVEQRPVACQDTTPALAYPERAGSGTVAGVPGVPGHEGRRSSEAGRAGIRSEDWQACAANAEPGGQLVADTDSKRAEHQQHTGGSTEAVERDLLGGCGETLADTDGGGWREQGDVGEAAGDTGAGQSRDCGAMGIAIGKRPQGNVGRELLGISARGLQSASRSSEWWAVEPNVGRVVDGPAGKVDRRKRLIGLGNSLVPQIPELIGRAIMAYEASASERAA